MSEYRPQLPHSSAIVLILMVAVGCGSNSVLQDHASSFVPADFEVPLHLKHTRFHLRPIQVADAERDFNAVISSVSHLRARFGESWPSDTFTVDDNREHLQRHEQQFAKREAFVYAVMSTDAATQLVCVYITPDETLESDAVVVSWVRSDNGDPGLPHALREALELWIGREWPFETVRYDGPLE